jgi:hypothetical protein
MESLEKVMRVIELSEGDKHMLAEAYDVAWKVLQEVLKHYDENWYVDKETLINAATQMKTKIATFATLFMTEDEFASIPTSMRK